MEPRALVMGDIDGDGVKNELIVGYPSGILVFDGDSGSLERITSAKA